MATPLHRLVAGQRLDVLGRRTGPVMGMDYEVFRLTRMREAYVHGASPGEAITVGLRYGGRVVASAAVIMIGVSPDASG
ncbi:MMPL family transporter [Streptomyces sp. NPDC090088]|uniref:MMPL family transporter n=1 Tax=Streptomyces sp. NPDC090088 TaxID=3365944 RepID=UPI003808B563